MREVTYKVYKFEELDEEAKQKALDNTRHWNIDHDWWRYVYDSAAEEGVNILSFDLYHQEIEIDVTNWEFDRDKAIEEIKAMPEFGTDLLEALDEDMDPDDVLEGYLEDYECELFQEETEELRNKWLKALQDEEEWLTSDECIAEMLIDNEYEFYENGEAF